MIERRCNDPAVGELLAAYEFGLLAEEERARFEAHMRGCEACAEELYRLAPFVTAMTADPGRARQALEAESTERPGQALEHPSLAWAQVRAWLRSGPIGWRTLAPVAAAAALVVAIGLWLRPSQVISYRSLARVEPIPFVPIETRGGGATDASRRLREGMARYAQRRYAEAAPLLAQAAKLGETSVARPDLDQARLFLGLSWLLASQVDSAVAPLEVAARSDLEPVSDRARWYLAQADLLRNDPQGAESLLTRLARQSPGYATAASEQLARLRAVRRPGSEPAR